MQYYHSIDGRETYIGKHIETKPDALNFNEGLRYLDADYGIWYIVSNGTWIVDKSEYSGTVYNSSGELVNTSDAYYDTATSGSPLYIYGKVIG